jgi:HPt (histidine-containing phosphotransfer) domain-containing protein
VFEELARIRAAFCLSLWPLCASLTRDASATLRGDRAAITRLSQVAHRIAGSAGTLELDALAAGAKDLEHALDRTQNDRWLAPWFATFRAAQAASLEALAAAAHLDRGGSAREAFCIVAGEWDATEAQFLNVTQAASVDSLPSPARGALIVDARNDATARLRHARACWTEGKPIVAILAGDSQAESLLALRAGADYLHPLALDISLSSLRLSAWAALPPAFSGAVVLLADGDSLRASFVRALLEPLGVRVLCEDAATAVEKRLRTDSPQVVIFDPANAQLQRLLLGQKAQNPDRFVVSIGPCPGTTAVVERTASLEATAQILGEVLREALGVAQAPKRLLDESTATMKVTRASMGSIEPVSKRRS